MRRALPFALAIVALGQPVGLCVAVSVAHALEHVLGDPGLPGSELEAAAEHGHSHPGSTVDHAHDAYPPETLGAAAPAGDSAPLECAAMVEPPEITKHSPSHGTGCDPPPRRLPLVLRI